jgi:hypothetical protein
MSKYSFNQAAYAQQQQQPQGGQNASRFGRVGYSKNAVATGEKFQRKHSGATKGTDKNGKQYFRGWNYSQQRGMLTIFVSAFKSSGEHTAKNGNVYTNLMAKVQYKNSGVEKLCGALLSHSTGRVTIPELGMVLNPSAPNGGYFGKFSK